MPCSSRHVYVEGLLYHNRTNGKSGAKAALLRSSSKKHARETWSYAPMPSNDETVVSSSISVKSLVIKATQSTPARVDKAYWKGLVACNTRSAYCCAIVRATNRRKTMPVAIPRTSPVGVPVSSTFWRAVRCATARPWRIDSGTSPTASFCAKK